MTASINPKLVIRSNESGKQAMQYFIRNILVHLRQYIATHVRVFGSVAQPGLREHRHQSA